MTFTVTFHLVNGATVTKEYTLNNEGNDNNKHHVLEKIRKEGLWISSTEYIFPGAIVKITAEPKV
jgi:hypothetical protein